MPPVCGKAPATSACVSAPHKASAPPTIQIEKSGSGPGSRSAMLAGERKMPEPIVVPMTTATALHKPSRRGSAEGGSTVVDSGMGQYARLRVVVGEGRGRLECAKCLKDAHATVTFRLATMHNHSIVSPALAKALFWAAVALCTVAHLAILRSVTRSMPGRRLEITWALIPAIALAALLVMTWRNIA